MAAWFLAPGPIALLILLCVILSYVLAYRRLSHIPGPRLAAWSNIWWVQAALSKRGHIRLYEACEEYGMHPGS